LPQIKYINSGNLM